MSNFEREVVDNYGFFDNKNFFIILEGMVDDEEILEIEEEYELIVKRVKKVDNFDGDEKLRFVGSFFFFLFVFWKVDSIW